LVDHLHHGLTLAVAGLDESPAGQCDGAEEEGGEAQANGAVIAERKLQIRLPDDYKIVAKCTPGGQTVKQPLYRYPQFAKVPLAGRGVKAGTIAIKHIN
jgi:hypothetical protein